VVEGARLERVYRATYLGFEPLAVRHYPLEKPENRTFNEKPSKSFATFEQSKKDTKYLQLLNNSYYFVWKYRKKVIKWDGEEFG
jgi:hypothetical protein